MNLTDLTLGIDISSAAKTPSVAPVLENYLAKAERFRAAEPAAADGLRAFHLPPSAVIGQKADIIDLLAKLVQAAGESASSS